MNKILVFRTFPSRTTAATLYFWRWFCNLQLELARPSYINQNIETFERLSVVEKRLVKFEHRKIVFVKVELSVTWNIWKRSLIQNKICWDPNEQSTRRHPVNINFPKKLVQHIGEVQSCLRIEIKHGYPCFIVLINYGYSFWC